MAVSPYRTGSPGSGNVAAKASTSSLSAFSSPRYFGSSSLSLNSFSVALGLMSFCTCRASSIPARMGGDVLVIPRSLHAMALPPCCSLGHSPAPSLPSEGLAALGNKLDSWEKTVKRTSFQPLPVQWGEFGWSQLWPGVLPPCGCRMVIPHLRVCSLASWWCLQTWPRLVLAPHAPGSPLWMNWATLRKSSCRKPREVSAGVPNRSPLGRRALTSPAPQ